MVQIVSDPLTGVYIAPFVSSMSAKGDDFTLSGIADAQEKVTIKDIDHDFTSTPLVLSDADSASFLNLFTVTGNTAGQSNLKAEFADSGTVGKDILERMIDNADADLAGWLKTEFKGSVAAWILDKIGVSVNDAAYDPNVTVHSDTGAADVVSNLTSDSKRPTTMYLQIPQSQLELSDYMDSSSNAKVDSLPLVRGDKLVFVFDVSVTNGTITLSWQTQDDTNAMTADGSYRSGVKVEDTNPMTTAATANVTDNTVTPAAADAAPPANKGSYAYHLGASSVNGSRRVALALQFSTGGNPFSVASRKFA